MPEIYRCLKCMEPLDSDETECPVCHSVNSSVEQSPIALQLYTILNGKYLVGKMLGQGGFGITYVGYDLTLDRKVAIKEYFPSQIAYRAREEENENTVTWDSRLLNTEQRENAYDRMQKEARKLASVSKVQNVVQVYDMFRENNTGYIVMEFVDGSTMAQKIEKEGPMKPDECIALLTPLMQGLEKMHKKGLIHRDISPDNIMLQQDDGEACLVDFGAAKDVNALANTQSVDVVRQGYSPLEQYISGGGIGPWTDVYAMASTIYTCITGDRLKPAFERVKDPEIDFPKEIEKKFPSVVSALRDALAVDRADRIQTIGELLKRLKQQRFPDAPARHAANPVLIAFLTTTLSVLLCVMLFETCLAAGFRAQFSPAGTKEMAEGIDFYGAVEKSVARQGKTPVEWFESQSEDGLKKRILYTEAGLRAIADSRIFRDALHQKIDEYVDDFENESGRGQLRTEEFLELANALSGDFLKHLHFVILDEDYAKLEANLNERNLSQYDFAVYRDKAPWIMSVARFLVSDIGFYTVIGLCVLFVLLIILMNHTWPSRIFGSFATPCLVAGLIHLLIWGVVQVVTIFFMNSMVGLGSIITQGFRIMLTILLWGGGILVVAGIICYMIENILSTTEKKHKKA